MTVIAPTELRGLVTRCPVCGRGGVDRVTIGPSSVAGRPSARVRAARPVTITHEDGTECRGAVDFGGAQPLERIR